MSNKKQPHLSPWRKVEAFGSQRLGLKKRYNNLALKYYPLRSLASPSGGEGR